MDHNFFFFNIPLQLNIRFQMSLITNNEDTKISVNIFSFFFETETWKWDYRQGLEYCKAFESKIYIQELYVRMLHTFTFTKY